MKKTARLIAFILVLAMVIPGVGVAASAEEPLNYLVLGDSIGWGMGVRNNTEACYGRIVADTEGYNYTNDAVNGYTTQALIDHLKKEEIRNDVIEADIISLSIGGNDFLLGNLIGLIIDAVVYKDYSRFDDIADSFYINFSTIIEEIRTLNPDAQILVQTLYNPRYDFLRDEYQQGADRLNAGYYRYLDENPGAYEIIDVATDFEGKEEYIAIDSIHPSAAGNVEIARLVLAKLVELDLGKNTQPVIKYEGVDMFDFSFSYFVILIKYLVRTAAA